jgi:hypothetical protein
VTAQVSRRQRVWALRFQLSFMQPGEPTQRCIPKHIHSTKSSWLASSLHRRPPSQTIIAADPVIFMPSPS